MQKIQEICETVLLQNSFLKGNRESIYFICMMLKSRKAKLKKQVKVNLGKYVRMFCIRRIFTKTLPGIFGIPKNQSILYPSMQVFEF